MGLALISIFHYHPGRRVLSTRKTIDDKDSADRDSRLCVIFKLFLQQSFEIQHDFRSAIRSVSNR